MKRLVALSIGSALFALGVSTPTYAPLMAEGESLSNPEISLSNGENTALETEIPSSSPENPSSSEEIASSSMTPIEEALKEQYDNFVNQQIFGVSLGAIIGTAISILGFIVTQIKQGKLGKGLQSKTEEMEKEYLKVENQVEAILEKFASMEEQYKELLGQYDEELAEMLKQLQAYGEKLAAYAKTSKKTDAILKTVTLLAKTDELTKKGISQIAEKNSKEAQ